MSHMTTVPSDVLLAASRAERDRWIRLFNRLERHVSRHHEAKGAGFCDDADDVLHQGWRQVMKEAQGDG